jgi:chemotaxis protein methyltransferase WspC
MAQIEKMLREKMGLDAASVGSGSIQRVIRLRMKSLGVADASVYRELLTQSKAEWDELVEAVVVTETWFFRDPEAFSVVVEAVKACPPGASLRVLTIPCSSGEEPYSLAIALREAGIAVERVRIDAVDISSRALARAKSGIYSKNSFRGKDLGYRERYFRGTNAGFVLEPEIRNSVKFAAGNLLNPDVLAEQQKYDFIFCRNLLIYFDRPTQQKALERLEALLASSGILFVGPAEQPLASEYGFVSANFSKAFACRRAGAARQLEEKVPAWQIPSTFPVTYSHLPEFAAARGAVRTGPDARSAAKENELPTGRPTAASSEVSPVKTDLDTARQLADAGRLQDAAVICERYLGSDNDSAQGWYLLGLIRDAGGDTSAVDCYRKALYLKPDHYETLLQMALWSQKNGDSARARTFKARAERAKGDTIPPNPETHRARYA